MISRTAHLKQLLRAYVPATEQERFDLQRMHELLGAAPDRNPETTLSRDHYTPGHFTASAFILSPDRQQLLLIYHSKLRRWLQPGGHVDTNDPDLHATARREVVEEVGLTELLDLQTAPFDIDIHSIPARPASPAHEHFDLRFAFLSQSLSTHAGSDASACRWVTLAALSQLDSDDSVLRAARKLVGGQLSGA